MAYRVTKKKHMNLPNKITAMRFLLVLVMIGILVFPYASMPNITLGQTQIPLVYLIALGLFVIASITDFLDGYLARKLNLITNFGKFLDPLADKVLTNAAFILLMVTPLWVTTDVIRVPAWVVIIMIVRDLAIDGIRMIGVSQGKVIAANKIGKVKTFLQIVAIILVFLNGWPFASLGLPTGFSIAELMLYLAAIVSLISLIIYLRQNKAIFYDHR
jgi:CDP-diacylglycerol---glycerol-3-phosphate 3-phosphatidyltransferase